MSTRAIYSFTDRDRIGTYNVYKHYDGYPAGAAEAIGNAIGNAWQLPRFEADEFAAAFVTSNKPQPGGVCLMPTGDWKKVAPADIEYRYEITCGDALHVKAFRVSCDYDSDEWTEEKIFDGTFEDFKLEPLNDENPQRSM